MSLFTQKLVGFFLSTFGVILDTIRATGQTGTNRRDPIWHNFGHVFDTKFTRIVRQNLHQKCHKKVFLRERIDLKDLRSELGCTLKGVRLKSQLGGQEAVRGLGVQRVYRALNRP